MIFWNFLTLWPYKYETEDINHPTENLWSPPWNTNAYPPQLWLQNSPAYETGYYMLKVFYSLVASSAHIINGAVLYNKFSLIFGVNRLVPDGTHNPLPMIIIIIILIITCMQGIYNYIPETNHISVVLRLFCVYNLYYIS